MLGALLVFRGNPAPGNMLLDFDGDRQCRNCETVFPPLGYDILKSESCTRLFSFHAARFSSTSEARCSLPRLSLRTDRAAPTCRSLIRCLPCSITSLSAAATCNTASISSNGTPAFAPRSAALIQAAARKTLFYLWACAAISRSSRQIRNRLLRPPSCQRSSSRWQRPPLENAKPKRRCERPAPLLHRMECQLSASFHRRSVRLPAARL